LKVRKYTGQIKELTIKLILYNLSKIIHVISICISSEVFSRAPDSLKILWIAGISLPVLYNPGAIIQTRHNP